MVFGPAPFLCNVTPRTHATYLRRGYLHRYLHDIPRYLLYDVEFFQKAVRLRLLDGYEFEPEILQETAVGLCMSQTHGAMAGMELLSCTSPCANKTVVMRAVECAPHSLRFAAPALRADLDVVCAAARRSPGVLRKVDAELRRHPEVARARLEGRDRSQIALSF